MEKEWQTGTIELAKEFTPPHMVQIPLEEYRKYIESTIKGPTVEISLVDYNYLKEDREMLRHRVGELEHQVRDMEKEIDRRVDTKTQIDQAIQRIIMELKVTESDTKKYGDTERTEVIGNGRI